MKTKSQVPFIPPDLVAYVASAFPDRLPQRATSVEELHMRIGEQRVMAFLRNQLAIQQEPNRSI